MREEALSKCNSSGFIYQGQSRLANGPIYYFLFTDMMDNSAEELSEKQFNYQFAASNINLRQAKNKEHKNGKKMVYC